MHNTNFSVIIFRRKITISGDVFQVDTNINVDKSASGRHTVSLHALTPSQNKYNFDLVANIQNDPRTKFGTFELDIELEREPKFTLKLDVGVKNLDLGRGQFVFSTNYELIRSGVKSLKTKKGSNYPALEFVVSVQPQNGKHVLEVAVSSQESLNIPLIL